MSTPRPHGDGESALISDEPELLDVAEHGDALDDPEYRELLGLDEQR
ncbi:hypothetical protein ACFQ08_31880 [Streptosporangium algeriense]|uniref:Uncharacterized protein n=1 Tax=Streptosporangium algeriense TaxID=1682748 RepID=A0ABW3E185_9ACTN